jgi:hypothetical protein
MKEINMTDNGEIEEVKKEDLKETQPVPKKEEKDEEKEEIKSREDKKTSNVDTKNVKVNENVENLKGKIVKKKGKSKEKKLGLNGENIEKKKAILILSVIGLVFLLGLAAFYYFGIYKYTPKPKDETIINIKNSYILAKEEPRIFAQVLVDTPQEPRTEESPVNGQLFTKSEMEEMMSRRPVAVMVNNHAKARPQSSLNSADIVYEALVESGITRYLAIFWSQGPKKVGPIRSARQYYLEWLSPYDPVFIHDGCAETENPRTDACGNIYAYNIKDIATSGAWRWNDGVRYAPHNEYSSIVTAWDIAENRGWDEFTTDFESWDFKNDANQDQRGDGYRYEIVFHNRLNNAGLYDSMWEYDSTTNSYKRWVGEKVDMDQETNSQVTAKVVIVQETSIYSAGDEYGRIITDTIGQGDALILMDGKEIEGTWKKNTRTDRTTFYNSNGDEIQFNRGRIWISVISQSLGEFDIIEQ